VDNSYNQTFRLKATFMDMGFYPLIYSETIYDDYGESQQSCFDYKLDTLKSHQIEITHLDNLNRVLAGNFDFTVYNQECQDTLTITQGHFNVFEY
jgi:hypothetical protein